MRYIFATLLQPDPSQSMQRAALDTTSIWHDMADALHHSLLRVLSLLIATLPGILAFIVALGLFAIAGVVLSAILRRGLTWINFDDRVTRYRGANNWVPSGSATALVARASFWVCVLLGLILGVSALDASYATGTALPLTLLPYLTHSVGAIFLLIAGSLVARFLQRSVLIGAVNAQLQYARFLALGVKWLVLVLTGAMVLDHMQIGGNVVELAFGILFGGIVLTLSLAIGLGSRHLVSRSLENHVERTTDRTPMPPSTAAAASTESLRHF